MKQLLFRPFLLLALLAGWGARAQTLLQSQSFENGEAVNYTATSLPQDNTTTCPGNAYCSTSATTAQRYNQYFQRVNETTSPYTLPTSPSNVWPLQPTTGAGLNGTYFWAAEGTRGGQSITARPPAALRLNSISTVAGKANLQVKVALLAGRASLQPYNPTTDSIRVQVRLNGGSAWSTIGEFTGDASGNMAQTKGNSSNPATLTEQMADFTFDVGSSANSMETRIVIANRTSEELAFDNIRVFGTAVSGAPPVVDNVETTSLNYAEGQAATPITQSITVSDTDSPTLNSGTVQFTSGFVSTEDELVFINQLGISGSYNATTGVLTLTGPASLANFQAAFRAVSYQNTNTINAKAGDRVVSFAVTDPTNLTSSPAVRTIAVTTALDAASGLPYSEDLETNGEGTRYASNTYVASNGTAWLRTSANPYSVSTTATTFSNISNTTYWYGTGTDNPANPNASRLGIFTTKQVNTTSYTNLKFSIRLGASNTGGTAAGNSQTSTWSTSEYVKLYYRTAGSSTWTAFGSFRGTSTSLGAAGVLRQDSDPNATSGVPTGTALSPALTNFSFDLPSSLNGQTLDFQLVLKSSDNPNDFAFDLIQVTGTATTTVNSIVRASTNPTNAATVNYTVTFGAPVTGLTAANFSLTTTGTVSGVSVGTPVSTGTGSTWTVPVSTGTGSGTLTLNLANDTNLSADVTTTLPFAGETYTIDKTAPTVAISSTAGASGTTTNTTPIPFTVTFSENVTGFVQGDLSVTNGSVTGFTAVNGTTYTFNVTPTTAGTATTVNVAANVASDVAGNGNTAASTYSLTYNLPTATVTGISKLAPTATQSATGTATAQVSFTVTFSASVSGVTATNFSLTAPSLTGASVASVDPATGPSATYTVTVNTGSGNGTLQLNVANATNITPSVTNTPYNGTGAVYTIIKSFPAAPLLTLRGAGSASNVVDVAAFVDLVQVVQNGTSTAVANGLQNGSFESNNVPAAAGSFLYPGSTPAVVASPWSFGSQTGLSRNGATGFSSTAADGVVVAFLQNGGVNSSITQNLAVPTGTYQVKFQTVQRGNNGVSDQVVNVFLKSGADDVFIGTIQPNSYTTYNTFTSAAFSVTAQTLTATISSTAGASGSTTATAPIPYTVTFSASVTGFDASDVTVAGGTLSGFTAVSGTTYSFNVTPTSSGLVTVNVPANAAVDGNNTGNTAASQYSLTYAQPVTAAPVVTAPANGSLTNSTTPTYQGTAPAGSLVTVYVDNASIGTTTATAGGSWSLAQPTALGQGQHSVYATAQASGSAVSANSATNTFIVDSVRPSVTLSSSAGANNGSTSTSPIPFTVTFSENVTGFVAGDVSVTGGTLSGFTAASGSTYSFNVTPASSSTTVTVNVAANVAVDQANNGNTAASQFSLTYQQPLAASAQAVTVQLDANGNATLNASSVNNGSTGAGTLTYTIQKIAFGYVPENAMLTLTTPNGANFTQIRFASYGTPNNSNGNYSLGSCNAANSLAAAQNAYVGRSSGTMYASNTDTRNNPVLGDPCGGTPKALAVQAGYSADAASLAYDCTEAGKTQYVLLTVSNGTSTSTSVAQVTVNAPPTATISSVSPSTAQRGATVAVTGTNLSGVNSVTVNGATATVSGLSATGFTFVVPSGATTGTGTLAVATPCAQTLTSAFNVAPALTATVSTTSASPTSTAPILFSVSFSQSVGTSFTASDVTVTGGTVNAASFGGSGAGPYTFTIAPSGTGTVSVSLAANVAQDANNTGNSASNLVSVQFQAPTITVAPASLPQGTQGTAYSQTLSASGGTAPYSYAITGGALPNGLSLNLSTGEISGTPIINGTFNFTVTARDNSTAPGPYSGSRNYSLVINPQPVTAAPVVTAPANGSLTSSTSPTYQGTAPAGSLVTVYVDGASIGTTTATGGSFSLAQPTALSQGQHTVYATAQAGGSTVSANSNTNFFTVDSVSPTVTISSTTAASGSTTTTNPFAFTVTFSESVTGFSASGVTVSNGTISGFSGSGTTYTFNVTPTTAGTATTVNVPANVATDNAGNGNTAAASTYALTLQTITWAGTISTDWFTAGNWLPKQVPGATIDATIPTAPSGGRFPAISAGTANVRNLTFNSGASLNQSGGTLVVAGDLTNNGTFQPTGGTVLLGNSTLSSILGSSNTRFWNLTVGANRAQQSTSASTSVQRLLLLNGNFATNGNPFTLNSTPNLTAQVTNNPGVVTGNVTVQRFIDPSLNPNLGYRHISTAVSGQTVSSLATGNFSPVVNPAYNASAQPGTTTPFPTVYGYDQSRLATATNNLPTFDKGWFSPNATSDALNVGQGYTALISGNQTWAFTGPLNNGTQTLTLARNTGATASDAGLSLVGNPYPSPLDWRQVASNGLSNVDASLYVFQSNDPTNPYAGQYGVYANGMGTISPILAQGQGFFVRVTAGQTSGTLTFANSQRPTTYTTTNYARTAAETRPLVQLSLKAAGQTTGDDAFVYFEQGSTEGFDSQYDARKLPNPSGLNLSTTVGSEQYSIDGRPAIGTVQRVIPLAVGVPAAGAYSLTSTQLLNLGTTPTYLRDLQTGALVDLVQQPSYQFTVSNASALITGRFELVFSPQQPLATATAALSQQVALYPNPAKKAAFVELPASLGRQAVTASLVDALGRVVRTVSLPAKGALAHQLDLSELATGVYALRLSTSAGVVVKKLVIE